MYKSEQELIDAGFSLSPQPINDGKGVGKLYEKIVDDIRVYFVVEADGLVNTLHSKIGVPDYFGKDEVKEVPLPPKKGRKPKNTE